MVEHKSTILSEDYVPYSAVDGGFLVFLTIMFLTADGETK